ncbi:hypothetical protein IP65_20265 [Novosphingobium sp. AAP1]|nr:hypothetical protein IP65_20265 [Novosphingobium sp. AAP1]
MLSEQAHIIGNPLDDRVKVIGQNFMVIDKAEVSDITACQQLCVQIEVERQHRDVREKAARKQAGGEPIERTT